MQSVAFPWVDSRWNNKGRPAERPATRRGRRLEPPRGWVRRAGARLAATRRAGLGGVRVRYSARSDMKCCAGGRYRVEFAPKWEVRGGVPGDGYQRSCYTACRCARWRLHGGDFRLDRDLGTHCGRSSLAIRGFGMRGEGGSPPRTCLNAATQVRADLGVVADQRFELRARE